jgi:hypothetical protein
MNLRLRWYGLGTPLGPDKMAVGGWGMWTCWLRGGRGADHRMPITCSEPGAALISR